MSYTIRVGNLSVAPHVTTVYAYYLQDAIAAMVAQDYEQGCAVDAQFESILPDPHRVVIYSHFIGVLSLTEPGVLGEAFFVPREEVVPASVLDRLVKPLPQTHPLAREVARSGGVARLRDRILDALQHGGMQRVCTQTDACLRFYWMTAKVTLDINFEADNHVLTVTRAWYDLDGAG